MTEQRDRIGGLGLGGDPGPGRDRVERGYHIASKRTWRRIALEYAAGASAAWLSARYGPAERTIAARARKEGWRKKDIALKADAAWDAEEAAAVGTVGAVDDVGGDGAELDLARARRLALGRAIGALEKGDARAAQDLMKLARMLESGGDGAGGERTEQEAAALAVVLEALGVEG